jgi:hypothetical protein
MPSSLTFSGGFSGGEEDAGSECDGHDLMKMEQHENSTLAEPHESTIPQDIMRRKPPPSSIRENSIPPPDYDLDSPLSASPTRDGKSALRFLKFYCYQMPSNYMRALLNDELTCRENIFSPAMIAVLNRENTLRCEYFV